MGKKKFNWKALLLVIIMLPCMFIFSACSSNTAGKSAYDLAVENGYTGTVTQWLASLNGTDGVNGVDGTNGSDVTISDIYNTAKLNGYAGTFMEFLEEYLSISAGTNQVSIATNKALLSAVSVYASFTKDVYVMVAPFSYQKQTQSYYSAGSGVIYQLDQTTGDAYLITNYHVVYDNDSNQTSHISDNISVYLYGMTEGISVSYIGGSMTYDIAILKITNSNILKQGTYRAVDVTNSNDISVGETVIAVGNPAASGISATSGYISVDSEYISMTAVDNETTLSTRVIRTDTSINGGNSGGGLFDINGKLVGIVNAKASSSEIENIAFAIPSNVAVNVAENIIDSVANLSSSKVNKVTLGIAYEGKNSRAVYDTDALKTNVVEDVTISEVTSSSLADVSGLKVNDVVKSLELNGFEYTITRVFQITDLVLQLRDGDVLSFNVLRNGVLTEVNLAISSAYFSIVD